MNSDEGPEEAPPAAVSLSQSFPRLADTEKLAGLTASYSETALSSSRKDEQSKEPKEETVDFRPTPKKLPKNPDRVIGRGVKGGRARSKSDYEISDEHERIQKLYLGTFRKHTVQNIDFEGILSLIGGCNRWQVLIYVIIAAQQLPHAMFNLSVVYLMYQPDHWCKIAGFTKSIVESKTRNEDGWSWQAVLNSNIAFPQVFNRQRGGRRWHDQCHYYDRGKDHFMELLGKNLTAAEELVAEQKVRIKQCSDWEYKETVMKSTVVTQWNRVCDDNWGRAHVHLSYSLGYILGCIVGGSVSDRHGRKAAIFTFGILSSIFGFLLPFIDTFHIFLLIRFLGAACNEAADLAAYVMCMEVTGVRYRSMVGSMLQAPWACGYVLLALVAYISKSWSTIQGVVVFMQIISLVPVYYLPESPRWLVVMNRMSEAEYIIRRACHLNKTSLPSGLGLVRHTEKRKWLAKNLDMPKIFQLFVAKTIRVRTVILFMMWIATALVYYGLIIALSDQSSPGRSLFVGHFFLNNAIAGAIELPTLVGCVILLRFGRKRSQMTTLIGAGVMIAVAMVVSTKHKTTLALLFMLAGKVCIQGAFNILYIFTSEMYPTVIRNSAVGICSMVSQMGSGAAGYIAILSDVTLPTVPMLIFSLFSLVAGLLVFFLPETQDLPLPDTILDAVRMLKTDTKHERTGLVESQRRGQIYGEREDSID